MRPAPGTLLLLPLLLLAPGARTQESNPGTVSAAVDARLRALPDKLAGLLRVDGGYDRPMAAYRGLSELDPVIAIVVTEATRPANWRAMAELGRANAVQAELIDTLFEGKFHIAGHAGANTYFGDYLTKQGVRQSWVAEYDGLRITVSATIYRAEDRRKTFDAIRRDLLGGVEMEKVSPADAN